ncbi:hypothetical protein F2Q68_00039351 [Brassica cretica]|uniref:Uncharacterized protein n=1 Tax=Brassica cretica TaxID=69181 RepID=A0A8S9MQ22_BRACR|nr:hypothetical protein F2Q68_00039351 [Brassica cretica]
MKNLVAFGARKEKSSESSDSDIDTDSKDYHVMLNKWLNLKNENLRLQHDLVQSREQYDDLAEELVVRALCVDGEGLKVKKTTHDGSRVLNKSWSKGGSTGASDRDAGENGDVLVQIMHISWGRKTWCGAHLVGEKGTFGVKFPDVRPEVVDDVVAEGDIVLSDEDHVESRC